MLPVSDVIPSRTTPWATVGLIAAHAIIFAYQLTLPAPALDALLSRRGFVAAEPSVTAAVTSLFFHENGAHLVLNLVALWIFGDNVEDRLGHGRFLMLFVFAGITSCAASAWITPLLTAPLIGASGAVAGVMGAYFVMFPRSRVLFLVPARAIVDAVELPALLVAGAWLTPQITGGLGPLTAPWIGAAAAAVWPILAGLAAGAFGARLGRRPERQRVEWWGA